MMTHIKSSAPLDNLKCLVTSFIAKLSYNPPKSSSLRRMMLQNALQTEVESWNIQVESEKHDYIYRVCIQSAAMAELSYHDHTFEAQLQIARFTWFMLYIDDLAHAMPSALQEFQFNILRKVPLNDKVLEHFVDNLTDMYHFWDALPANGIVCAALEFVNGCALENHPEIQSMSLHPSSTSWPYYLRAKTGVAPAYAFMIFTNDNHSNISNFMQVIADINIFIDLTNDILSYYKEFLAGENANYINNRSVVYGKAPELVLTEVVNEALAAHTRVSTTLENHANRESYSSWITFVNGYLAFHITQDRYRLGEFNL